MNTTTTTTANDILRIENQIFKKENKQLKKENRKLKSKKEEISDLIFRLLNIYLNGLATKPMKKKEVKTKSLFKDVKIKKEVIIIDDDDDDDNDNDALLPSIVYNLEEVVDEAQHTNIKVIEIPVYNNNIDVEEEEEEQEEEEQEDVEEEQEDVEEEHEQ